MVQEILLRLQEPRQSGKIKYVYNRESLGRAISLWVKSTLKDFSISQTYIVVPFIASAKASGADEQWLKFPKYLTHPKI